MRSPGLLLAAVAALPALSGCAGWVVFGHTIQGQQQVIASRPAPAPDSPPAATPQPAPSPAPILVANHLTLTITPTARKKLAGDPHFAEDALLAALQRQLHAHNLLDESDPHANGVIAISIDDFAARPTSNAVVFGYVLASGSLAGNLEVRAADGTELQSARIRAHSQLAFPAQSAPASGPQTNGLSPLYSKFANLTVETLTGTHVEPDRATLNR